MISRYLMISGLTPVHSDHSDTERRMPSHSTVQNRRDRPRQGFFLSANPSTSSAVHAFLILSAIVVSGIPSLADHSLALFVSPLWHNTEARLEDFPKYRRVALASFIRRR